MSERCVTVQEAQNDIRMIVWKSRETEEVTLLEAGGRILSEDLRAGESSPPFPRSPYDGYALRAADIQGANKKQPVCLKVVEKLCAGKYPKQVIGSGEAARIMTGAPIPNGADTVVKQEDTDYGEGIVQIYRSQNPYDHYCPQGEDFLAGEKLLTKGLRMDAIRIGIAAAAGCDRIRVVKKVRVAVLTTGSELAKPGTKLRPGQIYDSSLYLISERIRELGGEVVRMNSVLDEPEILKGRLREAARCADLIVTTGGVSVGEKDLIRQVLSQMGADKVFDRVFVKPGSPTSLFRLEETPVFALSGNPFAATVHMELLVRAAIARWYGCNELFPHEKRGFLLSNFGKSAVSDRYIRGTESGGRILLPNGKERSGILSSMNGCNCLVKIEQGRANLREGERVCYIKI